MNKVRFRVIVLIMSIAMLGLIAMQAYWLKHDFELKARQFDQNVMLAMNRMVEQIEESENLRIVVKNYIANGDSSVTSHGMNDSLLRILTEIASDAPPPPPQPGALMEFRKEINSRIDSYRQKNDERKKSGEAGLFRLDSALDIRIEKDIQQKEIIALKLEEQHFLPDSMEWMTEKRMQTRLQKLNSMMQKLTFQIVDPNGNIFDRISKRSLDSIVRVEMKNWNIGNEYSYGIIKNSENTVLYADSLADTSGILSSNFKLTLFPNDVFKKDDVLSIVIKDKNNYLLNSILPLLALSFIFTGLVIWGFSYTLRVILRQKKLAEMKNDFINNMTHEFKTPIATIAIANDSMNDPRVYQSPEKLRFYTDIIRDENQRMLRQVETVLQMAQIDKGEMVFNMEIIALEDLVDAAISSMKLTVEQRGGGITKKWKAIPSMINADPNHMMNVIINLLDNANKYSPEAPEILIESANEGNIISVSISDKGIGMTPEVQRKIFDNFYRVSSGNVHDVKGFGLGLSYVKAIMDKHSGTVEVISEPGKGSTFTLKIPIAKS
ncbi:MAG: HAMP domain-containing histidine kinase [Bacteroidetes bacterium]|nr:HAMP domain-containing histidine kinase [Bacteroidota bacterium]